MTTEKMRCHPSIILEKTWGFLTVWILILFSQAEHILTFFMEQDLSREDLLSLLPFLGFLVIFPVPAALYQFLIWRKTWIYIDENTFVIERNTLNRKKRTYGTAHIANINMEQNLFELLLHTCRLKLDMENASDADSTDISIVLSLKKAQELKTELLSFSDSGIPKSKQDSGNSDNRELSCASFSEILTHCICSLSGGYLVFIFVLAAFFGFLFFQGELTLSDLVFEEPTGNFFMKFLAVCIFVISYGYQLIRRLLAFYHFSVFRRGTDIMIHYGFFRKQDYTIPIARIQALQIVQPPIARLTGRCEARIVCIGIGDAKEELTQLSLCRKKTEVFHSLNQLLPEFPVSSLNSMRRPPKHAKKLYLLSCFSWIVLCCLLPFAVIISLHILEKTEDFLFLAGVCSFGAFCILLYFLLRYSCLGYALDDSFAVFSKGSLTRTVTMVPFSHIQHLCFHQNPLARRFRLFRGEVYILASAANRMVSFPYMAKVHRNLLCRKITNRTEDR